MASRESRRGRRGVPVWLWVVLALLAGLIGWLHLGDPMGDEGMANVFSFMAFAVGAILTLLWFVLGSGFSRLTRFGTFGGVALALFLFFTTVEITGFSGAMVPYLRWKFGAAEAGVNPVSMPRADNVGVDLVTTTPDDFPGFLGATRTGRVDGVRLARDWTTEPPELLWKIQVGAGLSGFAVVNGVCVTMEQRGDHEAVCAYDLASGEMLWSSGLPGEFSHPLGGRGPHVTPTITDGRVYALGARGLLSCLDGADGSVIWKHDLLADFGVSIEDEDARVQYGRSNSPLVFEGLTVVSAGGNPDGRMAGLVAYDASTGEQRWEGPPRAISHSSPTLAKLGGVSQILIVNEDTVSGHDPATGRLLWEHAWPGVTAADANNSQPIAIDEERVLVSKGYGSGAMLLSVKRGADGAWTSEELWHVRRSLRTKLTSAVVLDDAAYGLSDGILECIDLATGKRLWKGGRYGHGQILLVGDLLLVLGEEGELTLVEARPDIENSRLGSVDLLDGKTWNTFALYGDHLVARNGTEAAALRLPLAME